MDVRERQCIPVASRPQAATVSRLFGDDLASMLKRMMRSAIWLGVAMFLTLGPDASASVSQRPFSVSAVKRAFASQHINLSLVTAGAGGSSYETPILSGTLGNLSVVVQIGPAPRGEAAPDTALFWATADSLVLNDQYRGRAVGVFGNLAVTVSFLSDKDIPHRRAVPIPGRVTAALAALDGATAPTLTASRTCGRLARVPIPGAPPAAAATCSGLPHVRAAAYMFYATLPMSRPLTALIFYHVYADGDLARRAWRTDYSDAQGNGSKFVGRLASLGSMPSHLSVGTGYDEKGRLHGELYLSMLIGAVSATINVESRTAVPPNAAALSPAVKTLVAHVQAGEPRR